MTVHINDNISGPWAYTNQTAASQSQLFTVVVPMSMTKLGWYRADVTETSPSTLRFWNQLDGQPITAALTAPDNGSVGWQWLTLGTPIELVPGGVYQVVANWAASGNRANGDLALRPTYPIQFSLPEPGGRNGTNVNLLPGTVSSTTFWGVDVECEEPDYVPSPPTQPPVTGDIANELAKWLSESDATHRAGDGIPWDTWQNGLTALGDLTTLLGNLDNIAAGDVVTYGLSARSIGAGLSGALSLISTVLQIAQTLKGLLQTNGTGGPGYDYHGAIEDIRQKVYDLEGTGIPGDLQRLRQELRLLPDPTDPSRWTAGTPTSGTGWGFVSDGADMYRMVINVFEPARPAILLPNGSTWFPRMGWWAPVRDTYVGPRGFLEFDHMDIRWNSQHMDGLLVNVGPAVEWTVTPFNVDP